MRRSLPRLLTPVVVTCALLLAACNGDEASDGAAVTTAAGTADGEGTTPDDTAMETPPENPDKPDVEVPEEIPTELVVTVLREGSGPEAEEGDTVVVDYVGVRTRDGVEFDNSYDRFQPFTVVLGTGNVIPGWDQGLVGTQAGSRVQLDIPSDLAYGEEARGDIIGENEALTFVIDMRAVIKPADPADAPTEPGVPPSEGATETTFEDLLEGDGPALEAGQTGIIRYVVYRGDNLVELENNWEGEPLPIPTTTANGFPGFTKGLPGMQVGGRRAIIIPPDDAFGPEGNPGLGLPAGADMIVVVDLLGIFGTPE
jgi:FKBP-type peptidyl-prolyl cis-trans isomerase